MVDLPAALGGGQALVSTANVVNNAVLRGFEVNVLQTGGVGTVTQLGVYSPSLAASASPFLFVPVAVFLGDDNATPQAVDLGRVQRTVRTTIPAMLAPNGFQGLTPPETVATDFVLACRGTVQNKQSSILLAAAFDVFVPSEK